MTAATGRARGIIEVATGTGPLAGVIEGMKGLRGIDDVILSGIKDRLGGYEAANAYLIDELTRGRKPDPFGFDEVDSHRMPALPPLPANPILETNVLLDRMNEALEDQRGLIEASAETHRRETELLAELVQAFTASQVASDKATRHARMQAWIGIAVAIITGLAGLIPAIASFLK
jgi:hypothetical protein